MSEFEPTPPNTEPPPQPVVMLPRPPRAAWGGLVLGLLAISVLFNFLMFGAAAAGALSGDSGSRVEVELAGGGAGLGKIVVIPVEGVIKSHGPGSTAGIGQVVQDLEAARLDPDVRGVVLAIDSPGGGATAADMLHSAIGRFRADKNVPVVAWCGQLAASGGYYTAVACDRIFAHPNGVVGSIGVILPRYEIHGLLEKVGIEEGAIIAEGATIKDLGAPTHPLREEERVVLGALVEAMYDRFITVVDEGRPELDRAQVQELATGAIWTGTRARELGLVDQTGDLIDVARWVARDADASDARIVVYRREPGLLEGLLSALSPQTGFHVNPLAELANGPASYGPSYLWRGSASMLR